MIGSTFIYEPDKTKLAHIANDFDALDDFEHVNMNVLITLDFESICSSAKVKWSTGEPVIFDEETGLAIFQVTEQGLDYLLSKADELDPEQQADIAQLRTFLAKNGKSHIYELAAF